MADNVTLPGTGAVVASDDVGGVQYQYVKLDLGAGGASAPVAGSLPIAAAGGDYWPGYTGPEDTANQPLHVDPSGALITRGAVTTDEGTFRVNFANTSLAVSIGTVTVSGTTVTGTGFLAADVHYKDYFKLDADGESAWMGVASIDSDTQLTLRATYTGGTSGAASRALVRPVTGSGGAISVASGQATMTTGTTINAITRLVRDMDYAPLVYRARVSFSQRIANQFFRVGLSEVYTTSDRWFARFLIDGTTNTTVKCESARNPTTTPSAAETETTTVTIPNGLTTATLLDYRVEQLTESCRFYINGVLVAEHTRSIPSQHDEMEASVGCFNGASAPASSTTVVTDFITGKNHNKLEIGVMSDVERIVAAAVPLQQFTYSVAGVIAINTDLMVLDCSQLRSLFIQCNSMGTTGVVTVAWSNEPTFAQPITATLMSESGATSTTFNAAVMRVTNVLARYCRLRLTTATTAGTTTLNVWGAQTTYTPIVTTQPVSGTVTATVTGGTVVGVTPTTTNAILSSAATTNGTVAKASAGTVFGLTCSNTGAAAAFVKLYNSTTVTVGTTAVALTVPVPAGGVVSLNWGTQGMRYSTGICYSITNLAADTDTTAVTANQVKVNLSYI